jgi:hypothetical protein
MTALRLVVDDGRRQHIDTNIRMARNRVQAAALDYAGYHSEGWGDLAEAARAEVKFWKSQIRRLEAMK